MEKPGPKQDRKANDGSERGKRIADSIEWFVQNEAENLQRRAFLRPARQVRASGGRKGRRGGARGGRGATKEERGEETQEKAPIQEVQEECGEGAPLQSALPPRRSPVHGPGLHGANVGCCVGRAREPLTQSMMGAI